MAHRLGGSGDTGGVSEGDRKSEEPIVGSSMTGVNGDGSVEDA